MFRSRIVLAAIGLALAEAGHLLGQTQGAPDTGRVANAGFEDGSPGAPPVGWGFEGGPSYRAAVSEDQPAEGRLCVSIERTASPKRAPFGRLTQSVDARPYRGQKVRLRGAVRAEGAGRGNRAQMWCRVDRRDRAGKRQTAAIDAMADRPITRNAWGYYEIELTVANDADRIAFGLLLLGNGRAWIDDVSLAVVGKAIGVANDPAGGSPFDAIRPGLFEVVSSTRAFPRPPPAADAQDLPRDVNGQAPPEQPTLLFPLPLSYRDQVPLSFELTASPPGIVLGVDVYEDQPGNHVLKLTLDDVGKWGQLDIYWSSTVLVGPSSFDGAPPAAPIADVWPEEAEPWLAATWCADSDDARIQEIATNIRSDTSDVFEIIERTKATARGIFRSAEGRGANLTAVEALDNVGSCTSCANLVAALLRACGVPARMLAGYPAWTGPLQTHYLVEAYVPGYGWYPIESTLCRSPWPNTHQVNVAIIPPEYEEFAAARQRTMIAGGVPYLSLTESPGGDGSVWTTGTIEGAPRCDHSCRMTRALEGNTGEWERAIALARARWNAWLAADHQLQEGRLRFEAPADAADASSVAGVEMALRP